MSKQIKTLKPGNVYEMFVYPGADKWAKKEFFTVKETISHDEFMKVWLKKKRIPKGASYFFHARELGTLKGY
jgi:hypothetical protein